MRLHILSSRHSAKLFHNLPCHQSLNSGRRTCSRGSLSTLFIQPKRITTFSIKQIKQPAVTMPNLGEPRSLVQIKTADSDDLVRDDEFSDDISCLDHAPATSHGTYLAGTQDDVENLEDYQAGGYHPIHLGDHLGNTGRYHVIHKLGHGGFSTVWLCRDSEEGKYVAVKVLTADISADDLLDLRLRDLDRSAPGAEYINIPKDYFVLEGPNGTHQCLVLTLLGPRVSPRIWVEMQNPGPTLRKFCQQAACGLKFLHQNGLCHGDFRPANILLRLANLDHLSEDEVLSLLGQPEESEVLTESGENLPLSAPRYLVPSTNLLSLGAKYLIEQICIIDFGESFQSSSPPADIGIPEEYLAPEVLIEGGASIGPACDLWALGCTLFEIRRQIPLFYMIPDRDELLAEMVGFFGKLPELWWGQWEARANFFDENIALSHKTEGFKIGSKDKIALDMPEEEHKLLKDLLTKIFTYIPENRLSAAEVIQHDWFKM
ncbi:kinase-like domain-containing protein [Tricladium varicosporioides]|nr:kinase-like domain-containing protein [Hymenoscyphus varicosporioides]